MGTDPGYEVVKMLLETGRIRKLSDIQRHVAKKVMAADMNFHHRKMTRMLLYPEEFPITAICKLSVLIGTHPKNLLGLYIDPYLDEHYGQSDLASRQPKPATGINVKNEAGQ